MTIHGRCMFSCVIMPEACSFPNGPGHRRAERRQNINREGCVSDENDFASVRLNDAADSPSGSGKGNDGN